METSNSFMLNEFYKSDVVISIIYACLIEQKNENVNKNWGIKCLNDVLRQLVGKILIEMGFYMRWPHRNVLEY